uniref:Uncharacterized protein n=1 Tax=Oryza nivara TaxID=4536 RepID=A0A0E0GSU2_ORYNI
MRIGWLIVKFLLKFPSNHNRRRLQLGSPPFATPSSFTEKKGLDCLIIALEFSAVFLGLIQLWLRDAYSRTAASNTNDQATPVISTDASVIVGAEEWKAGAMASPTAGIRLTDWSEATGEVLQRQEKVLSKRRLPENKEKLSLHIYLRGLWL